jgi:GTP cyclohydrolase I
MNDRAEQLFEAYLREVGVDPALDPELSETPRRFTELLRRRFVGESEIPTLSLMAVETGRTDGPVIIRDLSFHAMCVHHVVPFFGRVHIAYFPNRSITGFGAFGRLVDWAARGPQLQERMTATIADVIHDQLDPRSVVVVSEARQMCMELTGTPCAPNTLSIAHRGMTDSADVIRTVQLLTGHRG